jgi:hypothetical protein
MLFTTLTKWSKSTLPAITCMNIMLQKGPNFTFMIYRPKMPNTNLIRRGKTQLSPNWRTYKIPDQYSSKMSKERLRSHSRLEDLKKIMITQCNVGSWTESWKRKMSISRKTAEIQIRSIVWLHYNTVQPCCITGAQHSTIPMLNFWFWWVYDVYKRY